MSTGQTYRRSAVQGFGASVADTYKARVPKRYRRQVLDLRVALRGRVASRRSLPDFLVIGAQRSGTSSLYKWLGEHPLVLPSLRKETEYFSLNYEKGEAWYRAHFPSLLRRRMLRQLRECEPLSFEATPYYLFHPFAPARAARLVPDAKLIVLLRNPVDRAYSHYHHMVRHGSETLSFEEAIKSEPERVAADIERLQIEPLHRSLAHHRFSYLARGRYAEQLERWLSEFPRDRFLVLSSEELYASPSSAYQQVLAFLGLPYKGPSGFRNHSYTSGASAKHGPMREDLRRSLLEEFEPENQRLYRLLQRDFGWAG